MWSWFNRFYVTCFLVLMACLLVQAEKIGGAGAESGVKQRLEFLRSEIARHNELYFKKAAPEITDAEFDALKREADRLAATLPPGTVPSVTGLGDDRSGEKPVGRHLEPMLSLDKAYTEKELRLFNDRVRRQIAFPHFVLEPKYDGVAISITYEKGKLLRAVTRGDGKEGEDVTENVVALTNVPQALQSSPEWH